MQLHKKKGIQNKCSRYTTDTVAQKTDGGRNPPGGVRSIELIFAGFVELLQSMVGYLHVFETVYLQHIASGLQHMGW